MKGRIPDMKVGAFNVTDLLIDMNTILEVM
jgi:hypothetical protein